jgi:hypothetical protein
MPEHRPDAIRDSLPRLSKLAIDTGEAASIESAVEQLREYRLSVLVGPQSASSAVNQATLLTLVNVACRCFLGGVQVCGALDAPLLCQLPIGTTLLDAVVSLGGRVVPAIDDSSPLVLIGSELTAPAEQWAIRTTFQGWRGGIAPADGGFSLRETWGITPAGVLAGALAASEAFSYIRGETSQAGFREIGLSLWDLEADWSQEKSDGPIELLLPTKLWTLGLGHLGQAYLWTLALLPYEDAASVEIFLQDVDEVSLSTASTSVLTAGKTVGRKKTRSVADWIEARGFRTSLLERYFESNLVRQKDDPQILLCGVDNASTRRQIEGPQFPFVVDAGIGKGPEDFRSISIHTFPSGRKAAEIWRDDPSETTVDLSLPAYQSLRKAGADQCGLTLLAETAVGAPFVGCAASALVIGEVLKLLVRGTVYASVDLDLRAVRQRTAVANPKSFSRLNPGYSKSRKAQ